MQKLWPFLRDIKFFWKKHQNSYLLFFLLTRSRNITKSYFLNFFQRFYHFLLCFRRLERRSTGGGGGGGGGGEKLKKKKTVAHHSANALQVSFQILIFLPPIQNFGRETYLWRTIFCTRSAFVGALRVNLKCLNHTPAQLTRSAREGHALRVVILPVAHTSLVRYG
jgi:hypothetical protein